MTRWQTIEIAVGQSRRTVSARRDGDLWLVTVDGRAYVVDAVRVGACWSLLVSAPPDPGSPAAAGAPRAARSYEVRIEHGSAAPAVQVEGTTIPVARAARRPAAVGGSAETGRQVVVAPMPGRIVKVLVRPGDAVTARQGLVVVEAMKMENELRASRPGTVSEVPAVEGATVEAGAILVTLD